MKDNHVPTRETCERLRELGFPNRGGFYYSKTKRNPEVRLMAITSVGDCQVCKCGDDERDLGYYTVAPLATELLECLPGDGYFRTQQHWQLEVTLDISLFNVAYVDWYENTLELVSVRHENLAEALAQMLIYLVENDYVKFNETKEDENR